MVVVDMGEPGPEQACTDALPCPFCGVGMVRYGGNATLYHPGTIGTAGCVLSGNGFAAEDLDRWNQRSGEDRMAMAVMIIELATMAGALEQKDLGRTLMRRARRIIEGGFPALIQAGEDNYRAWAMASLDHRPEGSVDSLRRVVHMIEEYAADTLPANAQGQHHFARVMLETAASEIKAFLAGQAAANG